MMKSLSRIVTVPKFLGFLCGPHKPGQKKKRLLEIECVGRLMAQAILPMIQTHYK